MRRDGQVALDPDFYRCGAPLKGGDAHYLTGLSLGAKIKDSHGGGAIVVWVVIGIDAQIWDSSELLSRWMGSVGCWNHLYGAYYKMTGR